MQVLVGMLVVVFISSSATEAVRVAPPNRSQEDRPVSQLEALDHYQGVWDSSFTITGQEESAQFKGVVRGEWVVGDQVMQQTSEYWREGASSTVIIRTMMTYNPQEDRYEYFYFPSSGGVQKSYGEWDGDAKTMTSTMKQDDGNATTIVADFSNPGVENWTIETQNATGETVAKIEGKNVRRESD